MEKKRSASFGGYLKTVRLEKGIKLSTISTQTRISKVTLAALEDEDHAQLPAEVFVKGFIRAYARVVGADGNVAVKGFVESRRLLEESRGHKADVIRARSNTSARLLIFLGIFVVIAAVAVFVLQTTKPVKTLEPTAPSSPPETAVVEEKPPVVKVTPQPAPPKVPAAEPEKIPVPIGNTPAAPVPEKEAGPPEETAALVRQRIHVQVVEETWLKVIIDSLTTHEYSLAPGDALELEAEKGFSLLIGNATGIQLTFNDNPVAIPGKSGQVVTIQLP